MRPNTQRTLRELLSVAFLSKKGQADYILTLTQTEQVWFSVALGVPGVDPVKLHEGLELDAARAAFVLVYKEWVLL